MREYFGIFGGGLKLQGITKKSTSISHEKLPGTARNLREMNKLSISQLKFYFYS